MNRYIQLVEDDEDIRFIVEYILEDSGYHVESFPNATLFLERTNKTEVDLVILDVMLPDGNGIDLCRAHKNDPLTEKIPVMVMSAHARAKSILEEACADDFISKPFDLDNFLRKVKLILNDK
ncbi:response regulator [Pedobacter sp. MC2016-14]|uniref:response regulator transcription factor n=1 Tax=Pedobacter sp. MC2016-14 TaxID=2897327 RepID=UPI001E4CECD0|nr:response regulator [Pedobacter sp. MC2016-14]MCD0489765.1 response regulator [Pedobacter sp. MC2016-14]